MKTTTSNVYFSSSFSTNIQLIHSFRECAMLKNYIPKYLPIICIFRRELPNNPFIIQQFILCIRTCRIHSKEFTFYDCYTHKANPVIGDSRY